MESSCEWNTTHSGRLGSGQVTVFNVHKATKPSFLLPAFYQGIFKVFNHFSMQKENCLSLYWLLDDPLIHDTQLDVTSRTSPALTRALISTRTVTLRQLVQLSGPDLTHSDHVATRLGVKSVRMIAQLLQRWRSALNLRSACSSGTTVLGWSALRTGEPNTVLSLVPSLSEVSGPLLGDGEKTAVGHA